MKFFLILLVVGYLNAEEGLIYYWPFNNNLNDLAGTANIVSGSNYKFVNDRFNKSNSAIYLKKGYLNLPEKLTMPSEFTITAWVNVQSKSNYQRIIDFGNGDANDNIIFYFRAGTTKLTAANFNGGNVCFEAVSTFELQLGKWYHVAYVLSGNVAIIFINGKPEAAQTLSSSHRNILRNRNYIGRSNWGTDEYADAIYDEIKIYEKSLIGTEILDQFNVNTKSMN